MNPAQLLDHFDRISDAPDAIPRLRRFILDLAVRGKLIEQDPRDEPASELLKRIQAEKSRLVKEGKIRKQQSLLQIEPDQVPFDIPAKWEWTRLGEIGLTQTGTTPSKNHGDHFGSHIPFIKPGDLYPNNVDYTNEGLSERGLNESGRIASVGSLLMVCIGTIGKCQLIDRDCSFNQQINSLSPYGSLCPRYLLAAFLSEYFQKSAWAASARTTIAILNKGKWELLLLPLPPLAEQQRIVAKVDELMALCDRLEAAQAERENRRDRLVASSLNRLNHGADADTFRDHARFYFNHLPRLTTRSEHIQQLRQTILTLAVRGKLVSQDPNDEPASELLKRIQAEKMRLVKEGKIKKDKPLPNISQAEKLFLLPDGWEWVRMQVAFDVRDGTHDTPRYIERDGVPLITSRNFVDGKISFDEAKLISWGDHESIKKRSGVDRGDILYSMIGGNIGNQVLVETDREFSIKNVALFKYYTRRESLPEYLNLFLKTVTIGLQDEAAGGAQPFVSLALLRNIPIPIPPLAEQQRIVAKVDELMALCDRLEAQLTTTQTESRRLLEAVLNEALASVI